MPLLSFLSLKGMVKLRRVILLWEHVIQEALKKTFGEGSSMFKAVLDQKLRCECLSICVRALYLTIACLTPAVSPD